MQCFHSVLVLRFGIFHIEIKRDGMGFGFCGEKHANNFSILFNDTMYSWWQKKKECCHSCTRWWCKTNKTWPSRSQLNICEQKQSERDRERTMEKLDTRFLWCDNENRTLLFLLSFRIKSLNALEKWNFFILRITRELAIISGHLFLTFEWCYLLVMWFLQICQPFLLFILFLWQFFPVVFFFCSLFSLTVNQLKQIPGKTISLSEKTLVSFIFISSFNCWMNTTNFILLDWNVEMKKKVRQNWMKKSVSTCEREIWGNCTQKERKWRQS